MSKATLEYDLSDPDEELKFRRAVAADQMAGVLWDLANGTGDARLSKHCETRYDVYEIREIINDALFAAGICIDDLWR